MSEAAKAIAIHLQDCGTHRYRYPCPPPPPPLPSSLPYPPPPARRVVSDAAKAGVLRGSLLREARADPSDLSLNSPAITQLGADWGAEPIAQVCTTGFHITSVPSPITCARRARHPALPLYPGLPDTSNATLCPLSVTPTYAR